MPGLRHGLEWVGAFLLDDGQILPAKRAPAKSEEVDAEAFRCRTQITAGELPIVHRFGDQVMYTLTDQRVMYVPPFLICKSERRDGNRRFIEWLVRPVEAEEQKAAADGAVLKAGPASNSASKANGKPNRTDTRRPL